MTIPELEAKKAELLAERKRLHELSVTDDRDLTHEEQAQFDAAGEQVERLSRRIADAKAVEEEQKQLAAVQPPKTGGSANTASGTKPSISNPRERILDDPNRGFNHLGEFAHCVFAAGNPSHTYRDEASKRLFAAQGMNQNIGSEGGFAVPPSFVTAVWDGLNQGVDSLIQYCDQYPISEGVDSITLNANAETSRATGSRYGGVRGYWLAEADQITKSTPKMRQVKVEPKELAVLVYCTDKLLRNGAGALNNYITNAATDEIRFLINDAIINGTGAGQPLGVLNSSCTVSVSKETGQAAATIVKENIDKMWSRLHPRSRQNAIWVHNVDVQPQLDNLSMAVGTGGVPVYLPPGGIADAPNARLKGRPAFPIEFCATLGTVGDILLLDLSAYIFAMRGSIRSDVSMHLRFDYAESAFRFMWEADGQPWLASALTPYKGAATLSTFVSLATRS